MRYSLATEVGKAWSGYDAAQRDADPSIARANTLLLFPPKLNQKAFISAKKYNSFLALLNRLLRLPLGTGMCAFALPLLKSTFKAATVVSTSQNLSNDQGINELLCSSTSVVAALWEEATHGYH